MRKSGKKKKPVPIKPFQLLVKPVAADCNMACGYCFYRSKNKLFGTGKHVMSDEVLDNFIAGYMGLGFDPAVLIWQGGEPTMAGVGFFRKVVDLEKKYGASGQRVGNAFQTNGLLIDEEWADFLAEYKFLVGLSIDGPKEIHDANRTTVGGSGTFDRVMRAAGLLRERGVAVNALAVVSGVNVERGREVYEFFSQNGFRDMQFIPCLERDATGRVASFCPTPGQYGAFLCEIFDEWSRFKGGMKNVRMFDNFLFRMAGRDENQLCTFAPQCGRYVVVEHNGDVFPCDFFVDPAWKCGNVMQKPLPGFFDTGRKRDFQKIKPNPNPGCKSCKWFDLCRAGCVKDWIDAEGNPARRSYFCESYKVFFRHAHKRLREMTGLLHEPGPNDPCPCGSGRKYKKCCM